MGVCRRSDAREVDGGDLHREVERYLIHEARLLDGRRFKEWLELFTEDVRYWMPVRSNRLSEGSGEGWEIEKELSNDHEVAFFNDDLAMLCRRVARFESGMAWSENPPSRTRHLITNIEVEADSDAHEYLVRSYFMIYQSRLETKISIYAGERIDVLRRIGGALKISRRKIILDSATLIAGNLSVLF
jgi:biphenyl 2,3-dioxygenase beta subunit